MRSEGKTSEEIGESVVLGALPPQPPETGLAACEVSARPSFSSRWSFPRRSSRRTGRDNV